MTSNKSRLEVAERPRVNFLYMGSTVAIRIVLQVHMHSGCKMKLKVNRDVQFFIAHLTSALALAHRSHSIDTGSIPGHAGRLGPTHLHGFGRMKSS